MGFGATGRTRSRDGRRRQEAGWRVIVTGRAGQGASAGALGAGLGEGASDVEGINSNWPGAKRMFRVVDLESVDLEESALTSR